MPTASRAFLSILWPHDARDDVPGPRGLLGSHLKAADVLELGREMLPFLQRLRDLQRAGGATHRPDL